MKRTISLILVVIMVAAMLTPLASSAMSPLPTDRVVPYTDVSSKAWYYNAVKASFDKGYLTGTSSNKFSPDLTVDRATFAVVLAKFSDTILDKCSSVCELTDVLDDSWYTQSINWCLENGYMAGYGDGTFGTHDPVTREQIVLILYSYASKNQADRGNINQNALNGYADIDKLHRWGNMETAMKWAISGGLISGRSKTTLAPSETATRAELAQIIMKFSSLYVARPELKITINGNDISKYTIIYAEKATPAQINAATELQKYLYLTNGTKIDVMPDSQKASRYEILIGKTNRTAEGMFAGVTEEEEVLITNIDDRLAIVGGSDRGTIYAVYELLEEFLGWRFYSSDLEACRAEKDIDLSGIMHRHTPSFEYRDVRMFRFDLEDISVKRKVNGASSRNITEERGGKVSIAGGDAYFVHNLNKYYGSDDQWVNTCISTNKDNLAIYLNSIDKVVKSGKNNKFISISAMDSAGHWCNCIDCRNDSVEYPLLYDRWMNFINAIAREVKVKYPDMKILTLSYLDTFDRIGTVVPEDNVIVMGCPIAESPTTPMSSAYHSDIRARLSKLKALCQNDNLYIWEYPKTLSDNMAPFPSLPSLCEHLRYYHELGAKGIFIEGDIKSAANLRSGRTVGWTGDGEFLELKSYIASKLLWNIYLTDEEIETLIVEFMQDKYGKGWEKIYNAYSFINSTAKLAGFKTDIFSNYVERNMSVLFTVNELLDLDRDFEEALSLAETRTQYDSICMTRVQIDAMIITKLWSSYTKSDDPAKRSYIYSVNERMYRAMVDYFIYPTGTNYTDAHKNETDFTKYTAKVLITQGAD